MPRRPMTDAQLATRTPEQQREVMKKRKQREAKKAGAMADRTKVINFPAASPPPAAQLPEEPPHGIDVIDVRARAMYERLQRKLITAGLWNDEAAHGPLMLYCKCVVAVEQAEDVKLLPAAVMVNVSKLHAQLNLASLPAERVRKSSKFGGDWG